MDQFLFQDMPEDKRAINLEAICEGREEMDYAVVLTPEEMAVEILVDRNLNVTLYSADLIQMGAELRELYLEDQVKAIQEIAPEIVIINV